MNSLRRLFAAAVLVCGPAALVAPVALAADSPRLTFVSAPDMWNTDFGDVAAMPGHDPGEPNSINPAYETAMTTVLGELASHNPDVALVAGDLVEGRWHADYDNVQIFGPVATHTQRQAAVRAAGNLYYPQWKERFARHGMQVHAAVGDHEIGDNPWPVGADKTRLVPDYKAVWARNFTLRDGGAYRYSNRPRGTRFERTAYAIRRGPVLVVTVDVFNRRRDTSIHAEVVGGQLDWLKQVLAAARAEATIEYVIVQGHVPVVTPVRSHASSALVMEAGTAGAFWKLLARYDVDLYLSGEVHDTTAAPYAGVEQIAHGGVIGYGNRTSYLVGNVYNDRLELELRGARVTALSQPGEKLWQTSWHRPRAASAVGTFSSIGRLVISRDGVASGRTGVFTGETWLP